MKGMIRSLLNRFGYDITKTDKWYTTGHFRDKSVRVGQFDVVMPGNNVQLTNYRVHPDLNSLLGILAGKLNQKYPGMTVVDVGANVGDTIAVIKSHADVPVIGIEGDEKSYTYLLKNTARFSDVKPVKVFLGDKKEEVKVNLDKAGWNTTVVPSGDGSHMLSLQTLDEVLNREDFKEASIKLLKTDVEGYDTIVLRGASGVIEKHHPVLFFEYNRENMDAIREDGLSTLMSFARAGYDKIAFLDPLGHLILATDYSREEVIRQLHDYAGKKGNTTGFFDICIFHKQDSELADSILSAL